MKVERVPAESLAVAQSRGMSAVEACASTAIGYMVALLAQLVILPLWGVRIPLENHAGIAACFTAVSLVRTYCVRRFFESRMVRSKRTPEGADPRAS